VVVLCVLLVAGMAFRVLVAKTVWMRPNADVTTAMAMALRASQGHPVLEFSGQNYGGALLTWVEGPLIRAFGFHMSLFWVVDNLLALLGAVVLWAVARSFLKPMAAAARGACSFSSLRSGFCTVPGEPVLPGQHRPRHPGGMVNPPLVPQSISGDRSRGSGCPQGWLSGHLPFALRLGSSRRAQEVIGWHVFLGSAAFLVVFLSRRRYEFAWYAASVVL
jgi:hypothetical protein